MRLVRYKYAGQTGYGAVQNGTVHRLSAPPFEGLYFSDPVASLVDVTLLAPVLPSKIIGAARNTYSLAQMRGWAPSVEPEFFLKPPSSVIGPDEPIVCPPRSQQVVYEAELAVVAGRKAWGVSAEEARQYILGYTCANDITARDLMLSDRLVARSKGFDTFCPLGPMIVTGAPMEDARITCRVNGEIRQDAALSDYIFSPEMLFSYISCVMTLLPGDVVLCGSPAGVGPLRPGDVVEVEIEGVGVLHNPVRARADTLHEPSVEANKWS